MSYTYLIAYAGQRFEETFFARFLNLGPSDAPVMHDYDAGSFETQAGDVITVDFFHDQRNFVFVDGHVGPYEE